MTNLEAVIAAAKFYRDLNLFDSDVLITDADGRILHYVGANSFAAKLKVGDIIKGGSTKEALTTGQVARAIIPEQAYGFKLRAIARPVLEEDGQLSGAVSMGISLQTEEILHNAAQTIAATAEQIAAVVEQLTATANQLAAGLTTVKEGSARIAEEIEKSKEILQMVNNLAANSNLLGLNAAIEAARAGELGRGFNVVAGEIRKMAVDSGQSVTRIRNILQSIQEETKGVAGVVASTAALGEQQALSTAELSASMQQLVLIASQIKDIAESV